MDKEEVRKNLEILTEVSSQLNREIGVCVCGDDDDNLYLDDVITVGAPCHGIITCTCSPIKLLFHTHPIGTPNPSSSDIEALIKSGVDAEYCIGTIENDKPKINCFNIAKLKSQSI